MSERRLAIGDAMATIFATKAMWNGMGEDARREMLMKADPESLCETVRLAAHFAEELFRLDLAVWFGHLAHEAYAVLKNVSPSDAEALLAEGLPLAVDEEE